MKSPRINIAEAWHSYRKRKSTVGIVTDFIFLAAIVLMLIPPVRFNLTVHLVRATLAQPRPAEAEQYITALDPWHVSTAAGTDTAIIGDIGRPTLYNFGGTWSPQSRAELRSLNAFAQKYKGKIDVLFLTDEEPATVEHYFGRQGYEIKPVFYNIDDTQGRTDLIGRFSIRVPATMLVSHNGLIVVKKFGAAKWLGDRIEHIADSIVTAAGL